ncbi:hypothetical protein HKX48_002798 [Thoreauomyces humboldtii]|nr:hypothetical protein HKX48_002798 [Thoreauomyces humboldtii]
MDCVSYERFSIFALFVVILFITFVPILGPQPPRRDTMHVPQLTTSMLLQALDDSTTAATMQNLTLLCRFLATLLYHGGAAASTSIKEKLGVGSIGRLGRHDQGPARFSTSEGETPVDAPASVFATGNDDEIQAISTGAHSRASTVVPAEEEGYDRTPVQEPTLVIVHTSFCEKRSHIQSCF